MGQNGTGGAGAGNRQGLGCIIAAVILVALLMLSVGFLLAWPYLSGKSGQRVKPGTYHSDTPLLPPPEHSDLGPASER